MGIPINISDYFEYTWSIARRFSSSSFPFDDASGYAAVGLMWAYKHYNPGMGEFKPYARKCIVGAIRVGQDVMGVKNNHVPLDESKMESLESFSFDPFEAVAFKEEIELLTSVINHLPRRGRRVLFRHLDGEQQIDIAREEGLSPSTINREVKKSLRSVTTRYQTARTEVRIPQQAPQSPETPLPRGPVAIQEEFYSIAGALARVRQQPDVVSVQRCVGSYELLELIGSGEMVEVYRARLSEFGENFELKMLRPDKAEKERQRFVEEIRISKIFNHPNVIRVVNHFEDDGVPGLVTEDVPGMDLEQLLDELGDRGERIPSELVVSLVVQVLRGLVHVHERGIVHRGIKPSNILLSREGVAKISDFSLAASLAERKIALVGSTGAPLEGAPGYMSPEQSSGGFVDFQTDLYSLGLVFYELLTGRPFFQGADLISAAKKAKRPLLSGVTGGDPAIEQVIERLLEPKRELRYQSAQSVLDDLAIDCAEGELAAFIESIENGEALAPRPLVPTEYVPVPTENRSHPARRKVLVGVAISTISICLTLCVLAWWHYRPALPEHRSVTTASEPSVDDSQESQASILESDLPLNDEPEPAPEKREVAGKNRPRRRAQKVTSSVSETQKATQGGDSASKESTPFQFRSGFPPNPYRARPASQTSSQSQSGFPPNPYRTQGAPK